MSKYTATIKLEVISRQAYGATDKEDFKKSLRNYLTAIPMLPHAPYIQAKSIEIE
jgi:hypothetical protein